VESSLWKRLWTLRKTDRGRERENKILLLCCQWQKQNFLLVFEIIFILLCQSSLSLVQGKFHTVFKGVYIRMINTSRAYSQVTDFSRHVRPVFCELRERLRQEDNLSRRSGVAERLRQEDNLSCRSGVAERARRHKLLNHLSLRDKNIYLSVCQI